MYRRTFDQAAHQKLKDTVFTLPGHWILSYDNVERARALYGSYAGFSTTALLYSARIDSTRRDSGDEIVVSNILETLWLERARQANLSSHTSDKRTSKTQSKLKFEHAPLATLI